MKSDDLKRDIANTIASARPSRALMEEVLDEIIVAMKADPNENTARAVAECGKTGALHDEALRQIRNVTVLLIAADEMKNEPALLAQFADICAEIFPVKRSASLFELARTQVKLDLKVCNNDTKSKFFRERFGIG